MTQQTKEIKNYIYQLRIKLTKAQTGKQRQGTKWGIKQWKQNKYVEKKGKKERIDLQSYVEVDEEDLYILKISCKGERAIGKANKGINIEKI